MIFVNYKTYEEATGENAIKLTGLLELTAHESQVKIIPVVSILDAEKVASATQLEVWVQHVDGAGYGAHTGSVLPEEVAKLGIVGVFLNHSEHKFENFDDLYKATEAAINSNLKTLVFAGSIEELKKICSLSPTYVCYEPPELVGSIETSVASAAPEMIKEAAEVARSFGLPLVVGAGIKSSEDVRKSIELGAVGIAVASDVVKATDPKEELMDLVKGFS